jgi:hypothetical protein
MNRHRDNQGRFIKGTCRVVSIPPVASSSSVARNPPHTNLLAGKYTRGRHTGRRLVAPPEPKEKSVVDNPEGQGSTPSETSEHIHIPCRSYNSGNSDWRDQQATRRRRDQSNMGARVSIENIVQSILGLG